MSQAAQLGFIKSSFPWLGLGTPRDVILGDEKTRFKRSLGELPRKLFTDGLGIPWGCVWAYLGTSLPSNAQTISKQWSGSQPRLRLNQVSFIPQNDVCAMEPQLELVHLRWYIYDLDPRRTFNIACKRTIYDER